MGARHGLAPISFNITLQPLVSLTFWTPSAMGSTDGENPKLGGLESLFYREV